MWKRTWCVCVTSQFVYLDSVGGTRVKFTSTPSCCCFSNSLTMKSLNSLYARHKSRFSMMRWKFPGSCPGTRRTKRIQIVWSERQTNKSKYKYHKQFRWKLCPIVSSNSPAIRFDDFSIDFPIPQSTVPWWTPSMDSDRNFVLVSRLQFRCPVRIPAVHLVRLEPTFCFQSEYESEQIQHTCDLEFMTVFRCLFVVVNSPGSIHIATKFGMFQEFASFDGCFHFVELHKMIVNAILFTRSWLSCGMRYTETERFGKFIEQFLQQCTFAGTRWTA